jgi:phosphoribosylformylglycinamidine synthase
MNNQNLHWQVPQRELVPEELDAATLVPEDATETEASAIANLASFGSSEYAKVVLGGLWGTPPPLDLDAEADLHTLLAVLADRRLVRSACDVSDGGIAVALAQAAFPLGVGATVEQEPSLSAYPLFGLFAEPASTMIVTAQPGHVAKIESLAGEYSFFAARIGTTGGNSLEISVDRQPFLSAPLTELRAPWASAREAALHDEVSA